jgi:hypothetical protein
MAISETLTKALLDPRVFWPLVFGIGGGVIGGVIGYNIGTPEGEFFGVRVIETTPICGLSGVILPPRSSITGKQVDPITIMIGNEPIQMSGGTLYGQFKLDSNGPFIKANVDGGEKPDDNIYVSYKEDGGIYYTIKCKEQPPLTPTPKPPATPTPQFFNLNNSHDRLTAYQRGFNGTKPAGKGGTIFSRRG